MERIPCVTLEPDEDRGHSTRALPVVRTLYPTVGSSRLEFRVWRFMDHGLLRVLGLACCLWVLLTRFQHVCGLKDFGASV